MKLGGYRVLPNSLRSANVHKRAQKLRPKKLQGTFTATNTDKTSLEDKIDKLFSGQDLLFERLETEPKWQRTKKVYEAGIQGARLTGTYVKRQPVALKAAAIIFVSIMAGGLYQLGLNDTPTSVSEVAGVVDPNQSTAAVGSIGGLPKEKPDFDILIPAGIKLANLDIVRISPAGNEPVYTYVDDFGGDEISISQQQIPKSFKDDNNTELERLAKSFQATSVIQIDDNKVFHGQSDKTKQQSLIFIKDELLVFIKSPQKLSDEAWAGYIMGLQKN
jgi:hypothetical protein